MKKTASLISIVLASQLLSTQLFAAPKLYNALGTKVEKTSLKCSKALQNSNIYRSSTMASCQEFTTELKSAFTLADNIQARMLKGEDVSADKKTYIRTLRKLHRKKSYIAFSLELKKVKVDVVEKVQSVAIIEKKSVKKELIDPNNTIASKTVLNVKNDVKVDSIVLEEEIQKNKIDESLVVAVIEQKDTSVENSIDLEDDLELQESQNQSVEVVKNEQKEVKSTKSKKSKKLVAKEPVVSEEKSEKVETIVASKDVPSKGKSSKAKYENMLSHYLEDAEKGDASAQYYTALAYNKLDEKEKSYEWLFESATQNYSAAQAKLGILFLNGYGVIEKNRIEGMFWLEEASEQGDVEAPYLLGTLYEKEDLHEAKEWMKVASSRGHKKAISWIEKNKQH